MLFKLHIFDKLYMLRHSKEKEKMPRDYKKQAEWRKEKTIYIGVNLNNNTDADIIEYIEERVEQGESKQGVIKRSLRSTMEQEGYKKEDE